MTSPTQGWVFFCNYATQENCFHACVVGSPEKYLSHFASLRVGDPVLLYNYESGLLVGHFKATSEVRLDILQAEWIRRYRAQVQLSLEKRFDRPVPKDKLVAIPGLNFNSRGYLSNFSLPIEIIQELLDLAEGRRKTIGEPGTKEESDFRKKFPANFLCSDGHWVRSKAELLVDNWLYTRNPPIAHAYERRLPIPEEAYADFYIPVGDCYIEYWGLETPDYTDRQRRKLELFRRYNFRIISLGERDLEKLDDILPGKLLKLFPSEYRFQ
jgi:hypothetical protein